MKGGSVAKRYANALLASALEIGQLEAIGRDLQTLNHELQQQAELRRALESPVIAPSEKKNLFEKIHERLKLQELLKNFGKLLIERDRFGELNLIALHYQTLADENLGQIRIAVKVATALDPAQEASLQNILGKKLQKKVLLTLETDPQLLGGLIVQVQDQVYDASLKRELEKLKIGILEKAVA